MLAINSVLQHLGLWNQQPLAYNLTVLNQDAYLPLPPSILPAVIVHTVVGAVCLVPVLRGRLKGWRGWGFHVVGGRAMPGGRGRNHRAPRKAPHPCPLAGSRPIRSLLP